MTKKPPVTRRTFLETAGIATGALVATGAFPHPAVGKVKGANEKLNFAILGPGGRAQAHIGHLLRMKKAGKLVDIVAVCYVWDGSKDVDIKEWNADDKYVKVGRGLYPSAERCGLSPDDKDHVCKDYRKLLDNKDIDAVVIATPDHWHAKMTIDACEAGKDVYCEKPMTHTIDEARRVTEAVKKNNRVMTVGVQSTAHPQWREANKLITAGKIGHVMQAQTSYYRNSDEGQWRYYNLTEDMTPKTIDWKMFLGTQFGLAPDMPFNRAKYAQWRCYWDFGGGMYTDLFVHQLTHLLQAVGVRFPRRVVGAGGLYLEYDGRDVPDVATVVADYDEGCQVLVMATMCNKTPIDEVIRGHTGTIKFTDDGFDVIPQAPDGRPAPANRSQSNAGAEHVAVKDAPNGRQEPDTRALWEHFIECIRSRNPETLCPPELGYAAIATVNMGVQSYREGKAYYFNKETGQVTTADSSWSAAWEKRSHERGKPNQVMGWHVGDEGSLLHAKDYQKLEGDWINGEDPARKV
ncbi:MAG TPA: Gfo/Idh/MocA family oxidoreductase [Isosphaeraceae bacterium]|nr:Gfo/Idh/MocA family oxidoreductase [Isosphaeraceae bacterium]